MYDINNSCCPSSLVYDLYDLIVQQISCYFSPSIVNCPQSLRFPHHSSSDLPIFFLDVLRVSSPLSHYFGSYVSLLPPFLHAWPAHWKRLFLISPRISGICLSCLCAVFLDSLCSRTTQREYSSIYFPLENKKFTLFGFELYPHFTTIHYYRSNEGRYGIYNSCGKKVKV